MLCWMLNWDNEHLACLSLMSGRQARKLTLNVFSTQKLTGCKMITGSWQHFLSPATIVKRYWTVSVKRKFFLFSIRLPRGGHFRVALSLVNKAWPAGPRIRTDVIANQEHYPGLSTKNVHQIDSNLSFTRKARREKSRQKKLEIWNYGFDHICLWDKCKTN